MKLPMSCRSSLRTGLLCDWAASSQSDGLPASGRSPPTVASSLPESRRRSTSAAKLFYTSRRTGRVLTRSGVLSGLTGSLPCGAAVRGCSRGAGWVGPPPCRESASKLSGCRPLPCHQSQFAGRSRCKYVNPSLFLVRGLGQIGESLRRATTTRKRPVDLILLPNKAMWIW